MRYFILPCFLVLNLSISSDLVAQRNDKRKGHREVEVKRVDRVKQRHVKRSEHYIRVSRLLSSDVKVADSELRKAIENRQGYEILLCCYAAETASVRFASLQYYLRLETYDGSLFRNEIKEICLEKKKRLKEVVAAAKIDSKLVKPGRLAQKPVRISVEKLCSPDPGLAREELRRAIRYRKTTELLLCSLIGNDPRSRVLAIAYFLHNENATSDEFRKRIQRLCSERRIRFGEIDRANPKR